MEFLQKNEEVKIFIDSLAADTKNQSKTSDFTFLLGKSFSASNLKKKLRKQTIDLLLI